MMTNSMLKYDTIEMDNYIVTDYTSKNFKTIYERLDEFPKIMFGTYLMEDNDKLERIAFELYNNEDYWDLLLLLNNRDPLFHMAYYNDYLYSLKNEELTKLVNHLSNGIKGEENLELFTETYYAEDESFDQYDRLKFFNNDILAKLELQNDVYRTLVYVRPSYIEDFFRMAYEKGII